MADRLKTLTPMVSDDVDDCVGALDACGVCNGPGDIYECGCADIPEGDCDCDGNQLDVSERGGHAEDADADGICDDVDDCVGALDAGVCNGPGEIYERGCADIPEGDCDATETSSTPLESGGMRWKTLTPMAFDDVDDRGALDACGVCNGPGDLRMRLCRHPRRRLRPQRKPARRPWRVWR